MSCDCNNTILSGCGDVNVPVVSAGVKISQLTSATSLSYNDLFVYVDVSAQQTKNVTFQNLLRSISGSYVTDTDSSATFLRTSGAWIEFNPSTKLDTSAFYPMSAIDHTVIQNIGTHSHSAIDSHIDDLSIHFPDAIDLQTYIRTSGSWVEFNPNTKFDTSGISIYATSANLEAHTSNTTIHYPMSAISGLAPTGGTSGQVLTKNTSGDYDYSWQNPSVGGVSNLVRGDEGSGNGYWLISDDRNNKGTIGNNAIDFSYNNISGTIYGATGAFSYAEGYKTISDGTSTHAEGDQTIAKIHASHAEGYLTSATANASHSEGSQTIASGDSSHAEGNLTLAVGPMTHAEGYNTIAEGAYTHSEGDSTLAQVHASHAEGYLTSATANASHAEGQNTIASGTISHAEGYNTTASGYASHAGGNSNIVTGNQGVVYGLNNSLSGTNSFVIGESNAVDGNANIVGGANNKLSDSQSRSSLITGEFNKINTSVFGVIAGNGNEVPVAVSSFIGGFDNRLLDATKSINSSVVVGRSNNFWGDITDSIISTNGIQVSGTNYPQLSTSIVGGRGHKIYSADAMIIGGLDNSINGNQGFITGEYNKYSGYFNTMLGSHSSIYPNVTRSCTMGQFNGIGTGLSVTMGNFGVAGINGGNDSYGDMFTCDFTFNNPSNTIDIVLSSSEPGFTLDGLFVTGTVAYNVVDSDGCILSQDFYVSITNVDYYELDNKVVLTYSGTNINTYGTIVNFRPNGDTAGSAMLVGGMGSTGHGSYSVTFGNQLINSGDMAVAFGNFNNSIGNMSFSHGNFSVAKGDMSFVYGFHSTGIGNMSFTTGEHNLTYGTYSVNFGRDNEIYTDLSFISGNNNTVGIYISQSDFSISDLNVNGVWKLNGNRSNIFTTGTCHFVYDHTGNYKDATVNITSVTYSGGVTTINYSLIGEGVQYVPRTSILRIKPNNSTSGKNSTIFGSNNTTITDNSVIVGIYNNHVSGDIFEIGVGSTSATRKNAFQVTSAGVLSAPQQNGNIVNDDHLVTKLYVTSAIASIPSSVPLYGATSARPITPATGTQYLDTTLGYPIWYLPPNWINATGATV